MAPTSTGEEEDHPPTSGISTLTLFLTSTPKSVSPLDMIRWAAISWPMVSAKATSASRSTPLLREEYSSQSGAAMTPATLPWFPLTGNALYKKLDRA